MGSWIFPLLLSCVHLIVPPSLSIIPVSLTLLVSPPLSVTKPPLALLWRLSTSEVWFVNHLAGMILCRSTVAGFSDNFLIKDFNFLHVFIYCFELGIACPFGDRLGFFFLPVWTWPMAATFGGIWSLSFKRFNTPNDLVES